MASRTIRRDLARQQAARERDKRWAGNWRSLRTAFALAGPGIVFLWGFAVGSSLSFAPVPIRLIAGVLMVLVAGTILWRLWRKERARSTAPG